MLTISATNYRCWFSVVWFLIWCSIGTPAPAAEFVISIIDAATRQPVAARVYVQNVDTGTRHFVRAHSTTDGVIYERQNWANKNSIEHHTSVPAAPLVAENLPAGTYLLTIERGKEYFPETRRIVLAEGEQRAVETVELRRWVNMAERGWYSGETHLHRPLNELPVVLQAEDLNVAMPLTYWVTKAFIAPSQGNKNQSGEIPGQLIMVDATHAIWPRNTEYEIFTVNEHKHTLGALFVLNHRSVLDMGAPDWKPIAERARAEGALLDMDKLDWPFAMTLPHTTGATLYELANNHMWRTEFGLTKWNSEAPAFLQPPNGGTGGDERDWLAYTLGQYYTLINAGFPLVPTAGTASGVHPVPAGFSRVYVPLEGRFAYEDWLIGLREGRSFVTTGPMLFARVNDQHPGATLSGGMALLKGQILSEHPLKTVDVVHNGRIIPAETRSTTRTEAGAWQTEVNAEIAFETSGWLCLRCTEDRPDGRLRFAHSAPWRMEIPDKPLRPSRQEKDYLVQRVKQEIVRSTGIVPDSSLAEYQAALQHFESLTVAETKHDDAVDSKVEVITPEFTSLVAVDAGLWPQIQVTDDGTLLALGYNAPAHTTLPADIECWASLDNGKTWAKRGLAAPRPAADANYCHWASGVIGKGELLVVVSGMDDAANAKGQRKPNDVRVFRSTDAGANWKPDGEFPSRMPGELKPYPFGSIVQSVDSRLRTLVYTSDEQHGNAEAAWIVSSDDRGRTWGNAQKLADGINESVLLPLPGKEWLCVARTSNKPAPKHGQELRQFRSVDDGLTWTDEGLIEGYHKHPPHLLRLADGRILLTYGNRRDGSIEARLSSNDGKSWTTPLKLYTTGPGDMGYPSTAQLPDGKLITVFYAQRSPLRDAYHMGAIGWTAPVTIRDRMWTWCVDASYDWPAHEEGELPGKNHMTPVESAVFLGVPNVMFIQYNGIPAAPFEQYYTPFKSLKQVYWTLSNNGNQVHTLGPEQEHVYRLAEANPNISGLLLDDFLIGPFPDENQSQWLAANSPKFPVTVEIQLSKMVLADSVLLTQSDWAAGGYRTAKFAIDATSNGTQWKEIATGELPDEGGASRSVKFAEQSLHSLRIRVLTSHDEEAPHGCGLHAVNLLCQDEPYSMETATITTDSEYPGHEASRLSRSKVVKTRSPKRFDSQVNAADLARAKQRMQSIGGRKLDLAVVVYTNQIDPGIIPILKDVDVVLLWTWKSSDLQNLEANFKRLKEILPEKRIVLGCYLWDYSNAQLMPLDRMERQCELGLKWLKAGEIEGMIFLGSGVLDKNLRSVEWTRQWIAKVAMEDLK